MRATLAAVLAAALIAAAGWLIWTPLAATPPSSEPPPFGAAEVLADAQLLSSAEIGVLEPSGVAYHASLDRLYVVGDDGHVAELDRAGRRLRVAAVRGDLEDVTVHTPTGYLLLVSEKKPRLICFDPRAFAEIARWHLDRSGLLDASPGKRHTGFEGIAFRPEKGKPGGGILSLAHQQLPAMIVHLVFDPGAARGSSLSSDTVRERWVFKRRLALTALTYVPALDRYLAIEGHRHELLVLDRNGDVAAALTIPGAQPEGVCLDARGDLWIADDQCGLWRCSGALARLMSLLSAGRTLPH